MGSPRLQFPLRLLVLGVVVSALLMSGVVQSSRHEAESQAIYHNQRRQDHLRSITEDVGFALACAREAARGAPSLPETVRVYIQPVSSVDCAQAPKVGHRAWFAIPIDSGWPAAAAERPRGESAIWWIKESVWWIAEAARDGRRAAWHGRMKQKWEQATSRPERSAFPDPPEP